MSKIKEKKGGENNDRLEEEREDGTETDTDTSFELDKKSKNSPLKQESVELLSENRNQCESRGN